SLNATIPRGTDPRSVNLEEAVELLREREARGPATRARKSTKKESSGTKKKATAKKKAGGTRKRTSSGARRAKKPPATTGEVVATMEAPPVGADDGNGRKDAPVAPDRAEAGPVGVADATKILTPP